MIAASGMLPLRPFAGRAELSVACWHRSSRHGVASQRAEMLGPHKITLALRHGLRDFMLMFYCVRPAVCWH